MGEAELAGFRQLLESRPIANVARLLLALMDALERRTIRVKCFVDTAAVLLRWKVLCLRKTIKKGLEGMTIICSRGTYLSL